MYILFCLQKKIWVSQIVHLYVFPFQKCSCAIYQNLHWPNMYFHPDIYSENDGSQEEATDEVNVESEDEKDKTSDLHSSSEEGLFAKSSK